MLPFRIFHLHIGPTPIFHLFLNYLSFTSLRWDCYALTFLHFLIIVCHPIYNSMKFNKAFFCAPDVHHNFLSNFLKSICFRGMVLWELSCALRKDAFPSCFAFSFCKICAIIYEHPAFFPTSLSLPKSTTCE